MRLSQEHIRALKRLAEEEAGPSARRRLFGSREPVGAAIDNLDRAERLDWLPSSEQMVDCPPATQPDGA
jgi:hypothetical protein